MTVQNHPHRADADLREIRGRPLCHGSILLEVGASRKPGAVHLPDFINAYNCARRLKTLRGLNPCEFIGKNRTIEPEPFKLDAIHPMPGLNT